MNEDVDVSEIIRSAQTEFNLSFSFDVSRMQNLFEQLCFTVQKLQNDITRLKKAIQNKADKNEIPVLPKDLIIISSKGNDEASNLPNPENSQKNTQENSQENKEEIIEDVIEDVKEEESEDSKISAPQSKPHTSRNDRNSEEFDERLKKCEDKIADFDQRFEQLSKFVTSEFPKKQNNGEDPKVQTRHELFEDFLDELDGKKAKDNAESQEAADSEKETETDNENQSNLEKEGDENQSKAPHKDDTLETFLDAAKIEIENAKKLLSDDFGQQMKDNNTKLNDQISKAATDSENGLKKANGRIIETATKFDTEIKEMTNNNNQQFAKLRETLENLSNKVKSLENRFEANSKASEMTKESLKNLVTDDGKIDSEQLLEQLEQHLIMINDMDGRLIALENRKQVSPDSFNTVVQTLSECTENVKKVESMLISAEMNTTELQDEFDKIKETLGNQVSKDQFSEMENVIHALQEESTNIREAVIKNNKDIINIRAAINTLRNHSEETRSISEDANSAVKQACEDVQNNDKMLKKMVVFMKEENGHISNQIKDITLRTERHDEAITELQKQREIDMARLDALKSASESYSDEYGTPRSAKSPKSKQSPQPPVETVSAATSPHLPSLSTATDPTSLGTPLPPPPSIPQLQPSQPSNTNRPPQTTDQSPLTISKRKPTDSSENGYGGYNGYSYNQSVKRSANGGLPRLAQQQTKRDIESVRMDLKRFDELFPRVERLESGLSQVKQLSDGLSKQVKLLCESKADRAELQNLFEQFRMALGELNNRLGGIRKTVASKADIVELKEVQKAFFRELAQTGETAAGTENVRCLMCGQPRTNVTGAIDDPTLARQIGSAMSSRVTGADGQGNVCFVYGEHGEMFLGRSIDGRPIYSGKVNEEEAANSKGNKAGQPPMTAPMMSRKIVDAPTVNS